MARSFLIYIFSAFLAFAPQSIRGGGQVNCTSQGTDQFKATVEFVDIAISSVVSFSSLVKKENYRTRITSFNNPVSSDLGFNLEREVMNALKPLLAKARQMNTAKFNQVVSSLVSSQSKTSVSRSVSSLGPVFPTLVSMVALLTVQEKKITKEDLDSFILYTSKYFVQYEKLELANHLFDQQIQLLERRLMDLQFDMREYVIDLAVILHPGLERMSTRKMTTEEIFLRYLADKSAWAKGAAYRYRYPADGIKSAKEIAYGLQKLFNEYLKIYADNYQQIRKILEEGRTLSRQVNTAQLETSLKDLQILFNESKTSDVHALRLETLMTRLDILVATEQGLGGG